MTFLSITPNASIDRLLHLPELHVGAVQRATAVQVEVGGKGLNVGRTLKILGQTVTMTGFITGQSGKQAEHLAAQEGLPVQWYWGNRGETRTNLHLLRPQGDVTLINEPGPTLSAADRQGFADHVRVLAAPAEVISFCGSLPLGLEPEWLPQLAGELAAAGKTVYIDTSHAPLTAVLQQPTNLCIKVNQLELAAGLGLETDSPTSEKIIAAGETLLKRGATLVVITLGSEGAIGMTAHDCWRAETPDITGICNLVSTAGCGDAMLAGLMAGQFEQRSLAESLRLGVACGTANISSHSPGQFEPSLLSPLLERVKLTQF